MSGPTAEAITKRARAALDEVEKELDGEVVLYNGPIGENGYGKLVSATLNIRERKRLILVLLTNGGSADSAYRMARYAQNFFTDFIVIVPSACKSAGTLLALGASKVFMSPFGELGPLDVQVFKADEIFERRSGLLSKSALWCLSEEAFKMFETVLLGIRQRSGGTISFKTASNVAAVMTGSMMSPVIGQIDPLAMGQDHQNLRIASEYGTRLIEKYGTVNEDAVEKLVELYPSHGFVIDPFEAMDLLGNVELATSPMLQLQAALASEMHRANSREVNVVRLRDLFGEDDHEADPDEKVTGEGSEGGNPSEGVSGPVQPRNRQRPPRTRSRRVRGNGAAPGGEAPAPGGETSSGA